MKRARLPVYALAVASATFLGLGIARADDATAARVSAADDWRPPPPTGNDGFDWIQLKSGEWLKGKIKSLQEDKLEFDSEELDLHEFERKDILTIRSPRLNSVRIGDREPIDGSVLVTTNEVFVITQTATNIYPRSQLVAITPTGSHERDKWSGQISVGVSIHQGQTDEVDVDTHARLQRRTPSTRLTLDYLGNYSTVNGTETENNQRGLVQFDYFLSRRLFVRVPDLEYFHDPLQNIQSRFTLGGSVGYDLIKTKRTEWDISAGPAYQFTQFDSVEVGESQNSDSIALVLASRYDIELTKRIDFILDYRGLFTGPNAGNNTQHTEATLEFEVHKRLTLDVSFIWDRVENPATESDGTTPSPNDTRLILGLGVNF